ncbi:MAG: hypothetical protein HRU31_01020 [Rhodobacteraceae bacterium]|nr:hypothetical protein [Paracoccaceae bacterium]
MLEDGGWVVLCNSYRDNTSPTDIDIYARLYTADGTARGAMFKVSPDESAVQYAARVFGLDNGGFVVTWHNEAGDNDVGAVMIRAFKADGSPNGKAFRVNKSTEDWQGAPQITKLSNGLLTVPYQQAEFNQRGNRTYSGSFVQIVSAHGRKLIGDPVSDPDNTENPFYGIWDIAGLTDNRLITTGLINTGGGEGIVFAQVNKLTGSGFLS